MIRSLRRCFGAALLFASGAAAASYHTFVIEQIYSNADGSVQFIVLHEAQGQNGENLLGGRTLTATHAGATNTFVFPRDLPGGGCTIYECNDAPTANARVLIATQGFAAIGALTPDYVIPNGFVPTGAGVLNYADVDTVSYASLPVDGTHAIDRNGASIPNLATNYSGASYSVVGQAAPPPAAAFANFQGLWWAAPPGSESGWGVNLNHQGTTIFATWFTFGLDGKPVWYVVSATSTPEAPNTFTGDLYTGTGPPFSAFDPSAVKPVKVGSASFAFSDANTATFSYTVNGIAQAKTITREQFGASLPTCTFGALADPALATDFQDLWWNAPANSEPGWGVNLTQQGDTVFATWFTYGADGSPLWFVGAATRTGPNTYSGTLYRMVSGPPFNAVPFDPAMVSGVPTGTLTLTFADGNHGTFAYTVDGLAQAKPIMREVLTAPGTTCQ